MTGQSSGGNEDDGRPEGRSSANFAAVVAVLVLVALGYWAFKYLDQQRKLQNCLNSGRRDCLELVSPAR